MNSADASATRMRQPPDRFFVGLQMKQKKQQGAAEAEAAAAAAGGGGG